MDMQFPNGQLRYMAGDGFMARGFIPIGGGGILQAHGKFPGEKRVSWSYKVSNLPDLSNISAFSANITTENSIAVNSELTVNSRMMYLRAFTR
jgi:hypothetical protein